MITFSLRCLSSLFFFSHIFVFQAMHASMIASSLDSDAVPLHKTCTWPVWATFCNPATGGLTCGALKTGAGSGALIRSFSMGGQLVPIAPEKVMYNQTADSINPLYNEAIIHVAGIVAPASMGGHDIERIIAVTAKNPADLIMIDMAYNSEGGIVRSTGDVRDALGEKSSGIVALEGSTGDICGAFAAVKPSQGMFGDVGSGIAVISFGQTEKTEHDGKKVKEWDFSQVPLTAKKDVVLAYPIDKKTPSIAIGNDVAHIGQHVALHWNDELRRVFVGLQVTAGSGEHDGACALLVGSLDTRYTTTGDDAVAYTSLNLEPCVAHDAINGTSAIVAARKPGAHIAISAITTFKTTTDLWHVAFVGGCGDAEKMKHMVYALPIIVGQKTAGMLAKKDQQPITYFGPKDHPTFIARHMPTRAQSSDTLLLHEDRAACVGAGPLTAGPIEKIITARDAIFAVVPGTGQKAGVYHSQAILDHQGRIKAWTAWQQVCHSTDYSMHTAFYNRLGGFFTLLTGATPDMPDTVRSTFWGAGDPKGFGPLVSFLRTMYTVKNNGIRACTDMPVGTAGLPHQSILAVGGYRAVTLALMEQRDNSGQMRPTRGDEFTTHIPGARIMHRTDGALKTIGTVETLVTAATHDNAWLFVGGTGGLCVYVNNDATGWDPHQGIEFDAPDSTFVPVGTYTFVRRLMHDENYLYVLTDDRLDRIDLEQSTFGLHGTCATTTIATSALFGSDRMPGMFTDLIVSGKKAFLATSRGLYCVGTDADIRDASCPDEAAWTHVDLGGFQDPVLQLSAVCVTGKTTDVARHGGGNLYVLQAYSGRDRATIKRFSLDDSITFIPDTRIQNASIAFRRIGSYTARCATDGALWMYIRKTAHQTSSLCVMHDIFPERDIALMPHNAGHGHFLFVQRCASSQGAWWAFGQTVVVNE